MAQTEQTVPTPTTKQYFKVQGDQLNMAVCFWCLVKSNLSCVRVYSSRNWTSYFFQGSRNTLSCLSGQLYIVVFINLY